MKIQIAATVSSDGFLLPPTTIPSRWPFTQKYTLAALREQADLLLHKNSSLLSLLAEKRESTDTTYLVEATPETVELIKGLLLYNLADELILYVVPSGQCTGGIALSEIIRLSDWEMDEEQNLGQEVVCRIYRRK